MSETKNLKLFKHDEPLESNENEFDIDKALNQNWDKVDEYVEQLNTDINSLQEENTKSKEEITNIKEEQETQNANIEENENKIVELQNKDTDQDNKILQLEIEKAELEEELKETKKDLYATCIHGQASGNSIHIEDSSGARCEIGISGNSKQETRSGKNVMPISNLGTNWGYTQNGIKNLKQNNGNTLTRFNVKKGQTIKFGLQVLTKVTNDISFSIYYTENNAEDTTNILNFAHINKNNINEKYEMSYTVSEDGQIHIKMWGNNNSEIFEFQLWAELNTLTDYEQYGVSPSPDYPSEIKTVGSNVNLYDEGKATTTTKNGMTLSYSNEKADIENKLNVFYAMNKISDEEYSELTLQVEDTYVEVEESVKEEE